MQLMHHAPYEFVCNHQPPDLKALLHFTHRTFNATDLLYCIQFLKHHYSTNDSLETAFTGNTLYHNTNVQEALIGFNTYFFSLPFAPIRTQKHIATPLKKSACKRLNMYLRWMVRQDDKGVDFGIWKNIKPYQLIIPIDVHVAKIATQLGLYNCQKTNWDTALQLTKVLQTLDSTDPVKYDYALFSMGVLGDIP